MRPSSQQLSSTGYSFETLRRRLREELRSRSATSVLLFDGVEALDNLEPIVDVARIDGVSVVCVADVLNGLEIPAEWPDYSSIEFHPYSAPELRELLSNWATSTFADEALSPEVIPLCAAYGVEAGGNARKALSLLQRAGDIAQNEQTSRILGRHVQRAKEELDRTHLEQALQRLDDHGHLLLHTLLSLNASGETPARTKTIRKRYEVLIEETDRSPLTERRMMDRLRTLSELDITSYTEHNEGRNGGMYRKYSLMADLDDLESLLAQDELRTSVSNSVDGVF